MKSVKNKDGSTTLWPCMESDEDEVKLTQEQQLRVDKLVKEMMLESVSEILKAIKSGRESQDD